MKKLRPLQAKRKDVQVYPASRRHSEDSKPAQVGPSFYPLLKETFEVPILGVSVASLDLKQGLVCQLTTNW